MRSLEEIRNINNNRETYQIVRFWKDGPSEIRANGLTLEDAQWHCNSKDSRGKDWFDGYEVES